MHILIIPSWYSSKEKPVKGIFFREQALALQRAGHKVGVLDVHTTRLEDLPKGLLPFISVEMDDGVAVYHASQRQLFLKSTYLYRGLIHRHGLAAYQRYKHEQGKPDIIHAHSCLYGGSLAAQIKRLDSTPVVMTEHLSKIANGRVSRQQATTIQETLRSVNKNTAVSQALADVLQKYAPEQNIEVIGNMVDGNMFFLPIEPSPLPQPFTFVVIATLTKIKGVDILLRAFACANSRRKSLLKIAGSGPEQNTLKRLARSLGIEDQVVFLGSVPREKVPDLLQHSHVCISSSYTETFGVTLIEALACGRPVIATRSGGPEDIVHEANGILVPTGDVDRLAGAIRTMVETFSTYDPEKIRADCLERYSTRAIINRLEGIYQGLAH